MTNSPRSANDYGHEEQGDSVDCDHDSERDKNAVDYAWGLYAEG